MEKLAAYYLNSGSVSSKSACPIIGGWVGSLGYEFGYAKEHRLQRLMPELTAPIMFAGLYLWFASEDLKTGLCYLWVHPELPVTQKEQLLHWLEMPAVPSLDHWSVNRTFIPTLAPKEFLDRVRRIQAYIQAGDCYQVNLSHSFEGSFSGDPWLAFSALSSAHPTPYAAFLRHEGRALVSVSPEQFLTINGGAVKTSPIKGTRPRGSSLETDTALADELQASEKDRAENLMIVDLLRNDLSLHAEPGSVQVEQLFALESYANVHHLVSQIKARLKPGISPLQALFDAFPGGSITGAPKMRAMEIIRELESHWRGPYCGSVFYYGLNGRLDSNIAIRTLLCEADGTIRCWGGGGIVADSDPEAEYQETLAKVGPLMRFLEELVIE